MKRRDLIRHLSEQGCMVRREGSSHTVVFNPTNKRSSTVPRHSEIHIILARKICRQLEISLPEAGS